MSLNCKSAFRSASKERNFSQRHFFKNLINDENLLASLSSSEQVSCVRILRETANKILVEGRDSINHRKNRLSINKSRRQIKVSWKNTKEVKNRWVIKRKPARNKKDELVWLWCDYCLLNGRCSSESLPLHEKFLRFLRVAIFKASKAKEKQTKMWKAWLTLMFTSQRSFCTDKV